MTVCYRTAYLEPKHVTDDLVPFFPMVSGFLACETEGRV